jgi:hypothetical protein
MTVPERYQGAELKCTQCGTPFRVSGVAGTAAAAMVPCPISLRLPHPVWGFAMTGLLLAAESGDYARGTLSLTSLFLGLSGWIFWLFCIYRLHDAIQEGTRGMHPITASEAAFLHLIPIFSLYWFFRWPSVFARTIQEQAGGKTVAGGILGIPIMFAYGMLGSQQLNVVGLLLLFSVYSYYRATLKAIFGFEA